MYAVIMAGGKGERLWPKSTQKKAKHVLTFGTKNVMIRQTIKRLKEFLPIQNIFLVTTKNQSSALKPYISDLDKKNIEFSKLSAQNQANNAKLEKERILLYSISGALILLLLIGFLVYSLFQREKRTRRVLAIQKGKISERNDQLIKSNKDKELLLAEIHHRVKNNLQVVSSLLSIQAMQLSDDKAIIAVKEGQARVQAMGMIHENLYQHHDFTGIDMHNYIKHLAESLITSYNYDLSKFSLVIDVGQIALDLDTAIPLGLITNELLTK